MAKIVGGPHRGHAAGDTDNEKAASQLASDVRYKVNKQLEQQGGRSRLNPAQVAKAYLAQWAKSPASPAVKALAKKKLMGEEYTSDVSELAEKSVVNALVKVFVESSKNVEEVEEDNYILQLEETEEKKYKIRVADKKTGNSYVRMATRAKIAELRANPNISSVEMTGYGEPTKTEKMKGSSTAKTKAGKGLDPVGQEDSDPDNDGKPNDPNDKYIMKRRKAIGKAIATRTEEVIYEKEGNDETKKITGKGVNNKKLIKVFPVEEQAPLSASSATTSTTQTKSPEQKRQEQQNDRARQQEAQILSRKLQALRSAPKGSDPSIMASFEPENELVDEAKAMGSVKSSDQNPKGAEIRVSSGRGMTMTPAKGLGASKPAGDDKARAQRQKDQAKADRIAAAKDRAASGEDRLSKLVRSVQNSSYQPEGEQIDEKITAETDMGAAITDFYTSKSPQLAGRTKKERRKAAIAAVLTARRGDRRLGEESCGYEDEKEPKLKKSEGGVEDPREIPTKTNLVKNKLRAMGLKMSYEPEGEQLDEISANLALTASQKADEMRRKASLAGDKETASKKAAQASRLYAGVGPRRAKERLNSSYEPEGEVIDERRREDKGTPRGPEPSPAFKLVSKVMGSGRMGVQPRGVKKQKGAPTPGPAVSPAQKVEKIRAARKGAQDNMSSRFD